MPGPPVNAECACLDTSKAANKVLQRRGSRGTRSDPREEALQPEALYGFNFEEGEATVWCLPTGTSSSWSPSLGAAFQYVTWSTKWTEVVRFSISICQKPAVTRGRLLQVMLYGGAALGAAPPTVHRTFKSPVPPKCLTRLRARAMRYAADKSTSRQAGRACGATAATMRLWVPAPGPRGELPMDYEA